MPIPNLIHPIPITIARQNKSVTIFDPVARTPFRSLVHAGEGLGTASNLILEGQVNFNQGHIQKSKYPAGGKERESMGYLLFRVVDLVSAGAAVEELDGSITFGISEGDRIVRVGFRVVNYFVTFFRDVAGYDDIGGLTLLEVNFTDRNPASTNTSEGS